MAKIQTPFRQNIPSNDAPNEYQHVESIELITAEISSRASTTTTVLREILARGDDMHYARHWGINE